MKARLNIVTLVLSLVGLAAYGFFQNAYPVEPAAQDSFPFTSLLAILMLVSASATTLYRMNQRLKEANHNIKMWRLFSKKTAVSAHKFIIDRIVDLRRPLQGLVGIHDLYTNASTKQEGLDFLEIADFCSRYLIRQLERIQFYSEIELGHMRFDNAVFSLQKCVQDAITTATEQARANHVTIIEEYSPSIPEYVIGNESSLRKILTELIDNSVRHGGNTKTIVKIYPDPENSERILFVVSDNGPGMSVAKLRDVLANIAPNSDSNIPWKDVRDGMGIILVKKILAQLGGNLNASSHSGMGATISFSLPPDRLKASPQAANRMPEVAADFEPSILIVDDEAITREVLGAQIKRLKLKADVAINGYEAIEKAKSKNYDLILMDLSMPIIDGFVASRTIMNMEEIKKKPKIVIVTSHCRQDDRRRCESIGVYGFLAKPLRYDLIKELFGKLGFVKDRGQKSILRDNKNSKPLTLSTSNLRVNELLNDNGQTVLTEQDNIVQVDFAASKSKPKIKKGSYFINFNSLFNSLDENWAMCKEILGRVARDSTSSLEEMANALANDNRRDLSDIIHRVHGELSMVHCVHGLEKLQNMQHLLKVGTLEELQDAFEDVSNFIDALCEEITELTKGDKQPAAS